MQVALRLLEIVLVQGIRPISWWETTKAKKAPQKAIILWVFLLAALVLMILNPSYLEKAIEWGLGK